MMFFFHEEKANILRYNILYTVRIVLLYFRYFRFITMLVIIYFDRSGIDCVEVYDYRSANYEHTAVQMESSGHDSTRILRL